MQMTTRRFHERERRIVASYASQAEAEEALQLLLDRKIDAECVTVIREEIVAPSRTDRSSDRLQRVLVGAVIGGLLGSVIGISIGLSLLTLPGVALGAFVGAWLARALHLANAGPSMPALVETERHDVVTARERAQEARRLLREERLR